jgi:hypothetical protein
MIAAADRAAGQHFLLPEEPAKRQGLPPGVW